MDSLNKKVFVQTDPDALKVAKRNVRSGHMTAAEAAKPLSFAQAEKLIHDGFKKIQASPCSVCGISLSAADQQRVKWCCYYDCPNTRKRTAQEAGVNPPSIE